MAGSKYFLDKQFDKAIGPYQKALDLEKSDRKLESRWWRMLIDNLGMAYGITGDLKSAEEVFRYGISKDPTYPLFYYNLACTYAERNDLDNTIQHLKTAFEYKQNVNPGEQMPDPKTTRCGASCKTTSSVSWSNRSEFGWLAGSLGRRRGCRTPCSEGGELRFACGMGMYRGSAVAVTSH